MNKAADILEELVDNAANTGKSQYLTFTLGNETYAVDILRVQEIRGWEGVTRVPSAPEYVKGVINLRGSIVPIVDLRLRFSLALVDYMPTTVVIVLTVTSDTRKRNIGVVVDSVADVVSLTQDTVKTTPQFGAQVSTEFIHGLGTVNDQMIMMLDMDRLFNSVDLGGVNMADADIALAEN